jgi:hypothetical protein
MRVQRGLLWGVVLRLLVLVLLLSPCWTGCPWSLEQARSAAWALQNAPN